MPAGFRKRHFTLEELGFVLAIGLKHLRLILLVGCLFLVTGLFYAAYARPVYYARSMITAEFTPRLMSTQAVYGDANIQYLRSILTSPALLVRTANRLGVKTTIETLNRDCLAKIRAIPQGNTIELNVWTYSHSVCARWAETTVEEFRRMRDERRRKRRDYEIEAHTQDMARARERMEQYVEETNAFMRESRLAQARLELEEVRYVPARLRTVSSQLVESEQVRDALQSNPQWGLVERFAFLQKRLPGDPNSLIGKTIREATAATGNGPGGGGPAVSRETVILPAEVRAGDDWEKLLAARSAAEKEFALAKEKYLPLHHKYTEAEAAIKKATQALESAYASFQNRLVFQIDQLTQEKESLEKLLPVYQERQATLGRLERDFKRFTAGRLDLDEEYRKMALRLEQLDFGGKYETMHVEFSGHKLLSRPERPRSPNRLKLAIFSLVGGLIAGVAAAFGMEYLTHTVSVIEQAEESLGIPGLGVIPELAGQRKGERPGLLTEGDHSQREVFRVIRTNLLLDQSLPEERKVILITSAMAKEGKSMTAANLATSFAQLGQKVLLIDADFHQGRQHRTFGVPSSPGLGGVLEGEVACEQACQPSSVPNLDIMPKDRKGRNVPELLSRPAFGEVMQELRGRYDRIIIDSPPVLGLSETCVLTPHVDGVVFVLWSSHTPVSQMQAALKTLAANGAQVFGCVVNRLDLGVATNYYYYYYYSDYYYHSYHRLPEGELAEGDGDESNETEVTGV
jgi:capsular exopolysaccharide synthesis family protein